MYDLFHGFAAISAYYYPNPSGCKSNRSSDFAAAGYSPSASRLIIVYAANATWPMASHCDINYQGTVDFSHARSEPFFWYHHFHVF
jgi:hypothetical protein